jgi:hypothetical protein
MQMNNGRGEHDVQDKLQLLDDKNLNIDLEKRTVGAGSYKARGICLFLLQGHQLQKQAYILTFHIPSVLRPP